MIESCIGVPLLLELVFLSFFYVNCTCRVIYTLFMLVEKVVLDKIGTPSIPIKKIV